MEIKKSDWTLFREAEQEGRVASMTSIGVRVQTELCERLNSYFRQSMPDYIGVFGEEEGEEVLENINEYIEDNKARRHTLGFPFNGSEVYLVPVTEHLTLKVLVADEYCGDGAYEKYVDASYFLVNNDTTEADVDALVKFVEEYVHS